MAAGADRGFDSRRVRTVLELGVLTGGVIAGGRFGPGTIVFALAMGPLIQTALQGLADHRASRDLRLRSPAQGVANFPALGRGPVQSHATPQQP